MTEISVESGDFPSGDTLGFINVITWAVTPELACKKLSDYLATFNWHMVELDSVCRVEDLVECSDEMEDMIGRASTNPEAIILGTFHSYKTN